MVVLIAALAGGAAVSGLLARLGTLLYRSLPKAWIFVANVILGATAGAMVAGLLAAGLNWLYEFNNYTRVFTSFLLVGAALGILVAVLTRKRDAIPIGIVIYTITRTILNVLRAIEALIWVIIFVVWVGIGPFAGVLALTLHTIAALGKLYSEQVESILPGPLEAVKATGATRLQLIMYAVIRKLSRRTFPLRFTAGISTCACQPSSVSPGAAGSASCYSKISTCSTTALPAPKCSRLRWWWP